MPIGSVWHLATAGVRGQGADVESGQLPGLSLRSARCGSIS